jgi:hypothetical protein
MRNITDVWCVLITYAHMLNVLKVIGIFVKFVNTEQDSYQKFVFVFLNYETHIRMVGITKHILCSVIKIECDVTQ